MYEIKEIYIYKRTFYINIYTYNSLIFSAARFIFIFRNKNIFIIKYNSSHCIQYLDLYSTSVVLPTIVLNNSSGVTLLFCNACI